MLYHKINSVFKRTQKGELILGDWSDPVFEYLANNTWRMTEKIDGTNIRILIQPIAGTIDPVDGKPAMSVRFGGRTENAQLPAPLVVWLAKKFMSHEMLVLLREKFPNGAVLFGEGFGAGIEKGGSNYQNFQSFILFDVNVGGWWLGWEDVVDVANTLGLPHVRLNGYMTLEQGIEEVRRGIYSAFGDFPAEGMVAVPQVPLFNRKGERVIAKIKTKDFERAVEA